MRGSTLRRVYPTGWDSVQKNLGMRYVFATIGGLIVLAAVIFGGWQAGWWFHSQNVQREYQVNRTSQQYQAGIIAQERDNALAYNAATSPSQKSAIKGTFCAMYPTLDPAPADLAADNAQICQ